MDWTQTVATAIFQGDPQLTQQNETRPLQPTPVAVPSPKAPPNRPAQPGVRRGVSVKSGNQRNIRLPCTGNRPGFPVSFAYFSGHWIG